MLEYSHEVFISYCRQTRWTRFAKEEFLPRLRQHLHGEVADDNVFFDETSIPVGANWPQDLRNALSRSKVMIALLTAAYFKSEWCRTEMAIMMERAHLLQRSGHANSTILLLPVQIADGTCYPEIIKDIQYANWKPYADCDIPPHSDRAFEFGRAVCKLVEDISDLLLSPPPWSEAWKELSGTTIYSHLEMVKPASLSSPSRFVGAI